MRRFRSVGCAGLGVWDSQVLECGMRRFRSVGCAGLRAWVKEQRLLR